MILRAVGHDVRTAYDGQQAVDMVEAFRPALAVLDIGMPRMNGYDTARSIRGKSYGNDVILVALTGWGQPEDKHRSQQAGFDHHLVKPVDPFLLDQLLAAPEGAPASSLARLSPPLAQAAERK